MGLDSDDGTGAGLDEEGQEGQEQGESTDETPKRKGKRKSSNYVLEMLLERKESDPGPELWEQVKEGFVSPEQALEFPVKTKLRGRFRAVRVASGVYEVTLVTLEPVVKISRMKERRKS